MNSVKSVSANFDYFCDNIKKDAPLYGDSGLDRKKNNVILEVTI